MPGAIQKRKQRKRPAIEKACRFLVEFIDTCRQNGTERLPTAVDLACRAQVSHVTMLRAINRLRASGLLHVSHGSGIHLVHSLQPTQTIDKEESSENPDATTAWRRVHDHLAHDIIAMHYPPGKKLPGSKALRLRYCTSHGTLQRALLQCANEGMLQIEGRSWRVTPNPQHRATVVLVIGTQHDQVIPLLTPRFPDFIRQLLDRCGMSGLNLEIVHYAPDNGGSFTRDSAEILENLKNGGRALLGFIIMTTGIMHLSGAPGMIASLTAWNKPMVIIDETGADTFFKTFASNRLIYVTGWGTGTMPGYVVGQYLLKLGHRTAAYISPFHKNLWSVQRLHGIREAFSLCNGTVHAFTLDQYNDPAEAFHDLSEIRRLVNTELRNVRDRISAGKPLAANIVEDLRLQFYPALKKRLTRQYLKPLLVRAIERGDITAIVCAGDDIALEALHFLKSRKVRVPEDLSIVSFDDTLEAAACRITSYNFNMPLAIGYTLRHLVSFSSSRPRRIDGAITVRASCGPLPGTKQ